MSPAQQVGSRAQQAGSRDQQVGSRAQQEESQAQQEGSQAQQEGSQAQLGEFRARQEEFRAQLEGSLAQREYQKGSPGTSFSSSIGTHQGQISYLDEGVLEAGPEAGLGRCLADVVTAAGAGAHGVVHAGRAHGGADLGRIHGQEHGHCANRKLHIYLLYALYQ